MEQSQKRYLSYVVALVAIVAIVVIVGLVKPQDANTGQALLVQEPILTEQTDTIPQVKPASGVNPLIPVPPSQPGSTFSATAFLASSDPPGTTDFYGTVTIDGQPAPEGTWVVANTSNGTGFQCGSFVVNGQSPGVGWYGFLHCSCGGAAPACTGEPIGFTINNRKAIVVGNAVWDESVKRVDLSIITKCGDGTPFGACEGNVPLYCAETAPNVGVVINNCAVCGCPPPKKIGGVPVPYVCCPTDGKCSLQNNPSACAYRDLN